MPGSGAPAMTGAPTISEGSRTTSRACATAFARASCKPPRASFRWRSRRSERQPSRSSKALPQGSEAVAHRAFAGDGDRRVRQGPVDARHRVAVREGRPREALEVDRIADLFRAPRAL